MPGASGQGQGQIKPLALSHFQPHHLTMASATATVQCPLCMEATGTATLSVTPGSPPTGPTYDCGGYPGDPDEIDDVEEIEWDCECRENVWYLLKEARHEDLRKKVLQVYDDAAENEIDMSTLNWSDDDD